MPVHNIEITDRLADLRHALVVIARVSEGITLVGTDELGSGAVMTAMASTAEQTVANALSALDDITEWCRAMDMNRIEREMQATDMLDSDEGQALRDLSRDLARRIEQICAPAMRAVTQMQNSAGEIDMMIQRARDMAGCYRPIHSPGRDPDRPESGSLCDTIGETMDPRTLRFAAAIERARARSQSERDEAA